MSQRTVGHRVDPETGCWIWQGAFRSNGYPACRRFTPYGRRETWAHRWYYAQHRGPIPEGMSVCHHCDNPACVNPEHLFLGTQLRNMRDASVKGRLSHSRCIGTGNPAARLTRADVLEIRRRYRAGRVSWRALAKQYGVTDSAVAKAAKGYTWAHLPP